MRRAGCRSAQNSRFDLLLWRAVGAVLSSDAHARRPMTKQQKLPPPADEQRSTGTAEPPPGLWRLRLLLALLLPALAYTFVRYAAFKGVPVAQWPLYLVNKAVSLTALSLLAISYLVRSVTWLSPRGAMRTRAVARYCGLAGFAMAGVHVTLSLLILTPDYFSDWFVAGKLTFAAELSLLGGVLGFWSLTLPAFATIPRTVPLQPSRWRLYQRMGYVALMLVIVHLVGMGWRKWFDPGSWPGFLPPITLLGAAVALTPLFVRVLRTIKHRRPRRRARERPLSA